MSDQEYADFSKAVLTMLYSHRYKKNDSFTEGIDFSIVRDVLYKYTTEAKARLLSNSMFAFLYHHFVEQGKVQFLKSKAHGKNQLYALELEKELYALDHSA